MKTRFPWLVVVLVSLLTFTSPGIAQAKDKDDPDDIDADQTFAVVGQPYFLRVAARKDATGDTTLSVYSYKIASVPSADKKTVAVTLTQLTAQDIEHNSTVKITDGHRRGHIRITPAATLANTSIAIVVYDGNDLVGTTILAVKKTDGGNLEAEVTSDERIRTVKSPIAVGRH